MSNGHLPPHNGPLGESRIGDLGDSATDFMEQHFRAILLGVAIVLVLGLSVVGIGHMRNNAVMAEQEKLAEIASVFPGDGGEVPVPAMRMSIDRYKAFLAEDPAPVTASVARFNLAQAHEAVGEMEPAAAIYGDLISGGGEVGAFARMRLAYVEADRGNRQAAEGHFQEILNSHPGLGPQAAIEWAALADRAGEIEEAITRYGQVMTRFGESPQAAESQARIRALGGEPLQQPGTAETAPAEGGAALH